MVSTQQCAHPEEHRDRICLCGMVRLSASEWHEGLRRSDMDPIAVRHIVDMENQIIQKFDSTGKKFIDALIGLHDKNKAIKIEELTKHLSDHFDDFAGAASAPFAIFMKEIVQRGRDNARKKLGFNRQIMRSMKVASIGDEDTQFSDSLEKSFSKVKSVSPEMIESLKQQWIENGAPANVVDDILKREERDVREEPLSREELKQRLYEIWREQKYILQRIIRTETTNTYGRTQLQEWYDQGVREVERWEVNDIKTCPKCRQLATPGNNIFQIEDVLKEEYPVTYLTHPNCRGGFSPKINMTAFDDLESKINDIDGFQSSEDVSSNDGASTAENVPTEYVDQVKRALNDFGSDFGVKFVPDIASSEEWQKDRMEELEVFYNPQEAQSRMDIERAEMSGSIIQYTTRSGLLLVSGNAGDVNRVVIPILRDRGDRIWNTEATEDQKDWVRERFEQKNKEMVLNIKEHDLEIVGDNQFITPLAGQSPESYFSESFACFVCDPTRILYMDEPFYNFLRANFMGGKEYILNGGIS